MLKSRFLDSGGGGGKKQKSNINVTIGSSSDSDFPSLSEVVVTKATVVPSGTPDKTSAPGNAGNPNEVGRESVMKEILASYANKLSPTSLTKANLQKLDATMLNDADYDACFSCRGMGCFDSMLRDGPWMIRGVLIFINKWSPSVSLLQEDLSHVPVLVKFHDVQLAAYTSDGRRSYARILIKIDARNDFSNNLVMVFPNLEGTRYTKETIRVEYEWKPPRCSKDGSSEADDEGFVEVKKKKSGGNGTFSLSNSFEALNFEILVSKEVEMGNNASTSDYSGDQDSKDEIESVDNEMASYVASKPSGVGYGTKSLLEKWRETYVNDDYDPYNDDIYEGLNIHDNIQSICDNLDIKVRGRMKK
ncbi:ribonuclease H-like domain-containing protein [Tanacetum coccineum]|uniref:Ribonuclease H-like domain-containing protein n=1 Tax=Tanacetum coccineum TaxID=301880 RepID=A0ABQ5I311_9ASTR